MRDFTDWVWLWIRLHVQEDAVLITSTDVEKLKVGNNFPWYEALFFLRTEKASWALAEHVCVCPPSAGQCGLTSQDFLP